MVMDKLLHPPKFQSPHTKSHLYLHPLTNNSNVTPHLLECVFSDLPRPTKQESVFNNTPVKSPHTNMMLGTEETIEDN